MTALPATTPTSASSGYDASKSTTKRKRSSTSSLVSEDNVLSGRRRNLIANARDLTRNMSIAAWAVRKHLDYVSTFRFQAKTGNDELDDRLEFLVREWSDPINCDVTGRHPLERIVRMAEERRVLDGDIGIVLLADGRLQAVEGDRICTPTKLPGYMAEDRVIEGVYLDQSGKPESYIVCKRSPYQNVREIDQIIPSEFFPVLAYYSRFDQVRGISPLAPAINAFQDLYEACDYALAKMKLAQMLGLIIYREGSAPIGTLTESSESADGEMTYDVNLGTGGPFKLELERGDNVKEFESKTPSSEFQAFLKTQINFCLKALDIPPSFYDVSATNYSGARQELIAYEQSCENKRGDLRRLLDRVTRWRIGLWVEDGFLTADEAAACRWEWISAGVPWIDPLKEVKAQVAAIECGLTSRTRVCKENGVDFYDIADELASEKEYLNSKGLSTDAAVVNAAISGDTQNADQE